MDRPRKVLQAAARDAATRARQLAEALDAVADTVEPSEALPGPSYPVHAAMPQGERLWTVADVAEFVGASESWVRNAVAAERLPCTRIGGLVRFQPEEIRARMRKEFPVSATVLPRTAPKR